MRRTLALILIVLTSLVACSRDPSREQAKPQGKSLIQKDPLTAAREDIAKDPSNAQAWFHLADLYERNSMYKEEIDALKKVLQLNPGMSYAYVKLGTACNRLSLYDEAIRSFRKAARTSQQRRNPVLYNNLAYSYGKKGRINEQIASLKKALAIRPSYATARFNLGIAYLNKGNPKLALAEYRTLMNYDEGAAASLKQEIDSRHRGKTSR